MRRRGPSGSQGSQTSKGVLGKEPCSKNSKFVERKTQRDREWRAPSPLQLQSAIPAWSFELDDTERFLLDHYIQRFSRVYPTCSDPSNPFLRVFLPLSVRSRAVLDALLALSGVQCWENGSFTLGARLLRVRQNALRSCIELVEGVTHSSQTQHCPLEFAFSGPEKADSTIEWAIDCTDATRREEVLHLLASCVLFMLYEKLAGEGGRHGSPHLQFLARILPANVIRATTRASPPGGSGNRIWSDEFQFLASLFLYNDLVWSTSLGTPTLFDLYLHLEEGAVATHDEFSQDRGSSYSSRRFQFPHIIARISAGDRGVTDAEIASWQGTLDWLPSFALAPHKKRQAHCPVPISEPALVMDPRFRFLGVIINLEGLDESGAITELYRVAAATYRRTSLSRCSVETAPDGSAMDIDVCEQPVGNLASWAVQLISHLPEGSVFENSLLWPMGVIAKVLTASDTEERQMVMNRLKSLERRFKMRNFCRVREYLEKVWTSSDMGEAVQDEEAVLFG
ncbi:Fungal specific transcription factor domain-containing protein [Pleurostoma richardsiae]|uniref:Fungal specific transcription factor domain-containing protein n=1 Tax=Pleurostoma richardsiae TaxID=41990 RepID=A0AA38RJ32_9PEZI|nr:Fungal specific transcription factor domain-containing protein [Pleurostoma richardsiae]